MGHVSMPVFQTYCIDDGSSWSEETALNQMVMQCRNNGHAEWVSCCKYLQDGRIVSGAMDSKVCVWAAKGTRSQTLEGHSGPIAALETLSNPSVDALLASASYDKSIRLWQVSPPELTVIKREGHKSYQDPHS